MFYTLISTKNQSGIEDLTGLRFVTEGVATSDTFGIHCVYPFPTCRQH